MSGPIVAFSNIMDGDSKITFESFGHTREEAIQKRDALVKKYAAPELLKALQNLLALYDDLNKQGCHQNAVLDRENEARIDADDKARAAIAKAATQNK